MNRRVASLRSRNRSLSLALSAFSLSPPHCAYANHSTASTAQLSYKTSLPALTSPALLATSPTHTQIQARTYTHTASRTNALKLRHRTRCGGVVGSVVSVLDKHSERHVRAPACALLVSIHSVCVVPVPVFVSLPVPVSLSVCEPVRRKPEKAANSRSVANLCCNRRYIVQKIVKLQQQQPQQ